MTTFYQWDETRIRERLEAERLILAADLNDRTHFRVLDHSADKVAVIVTTSTGFAAVTNEPDPKYFAVTTPAREQQFFTALTQVIGANA